MGKKSKCYVQNISQKDQHAHSALAPIVLSEFFEFHFCLLKIAGILLYDDTILLVLNL